MARALVRLAGCVVAAGLLTATGLAGSANLLWNGEFHFEAFEAARDDGKASSHSGSVPYWDQEGYGAAEVYRAPANGVFRPRFPVDGVVRLRPGKSLTQLVLLSEAELEADARVSLDVWGHQARPGALRATLCAMQLDDAPGEWSPVKFGQKDARTFPRHARGELVRVPVSSRDSEAASDFELKLAGVPLTGGLTLGVQVEFTNVSDDDAWIYAPCLSEGAEAQSRLPAQRALPDYYAHLPRTIARLRRGEPLHVIVMGSSIDRGSANPPPYLYDEDPHSAHFKEPISGADSLFDGQQVGHPEWNPYIGQWRHYFSFGGRLRRDLMRRFDYPIDRLLLNFMACDGSSIGEAHSALEPWATLALPPNPENNGQAAGRTWSELYPAVFARPEGARPDLVIFGSGANEKIDGAEEAAVFEGAIRWFQRRYPGVEFLVGMWSTQEKGTAAGAMKSVALAYGIPFLDVGRAVGLDARFAGKIGFSPGDEHPQAAAHYLWSRLLERAFEPVDPIATGVPQADLPARVSAETIGWEGEMRTYAADSPRLHRNAFVFDDAAVNLWADGTDAKVGVRIDGRPNTDPAFHNGSWLKPVKARNPRNSVFAIGRLSFGDRHIVEVEGAGVRLLAVDAKTALNRVWHGVESKSWDLGDTRPEAFVSEWGAPYGTTQVKLAVGATAQLRWVGTDCSVAWAPGAGCGVLVAKIDGQESLREPANVPFTLADGQPAYVEDRRGIRGLPFGVHELEVIARDGPVALLGAFSYDTRANLQGQRELQGWAAPGDRVEFSAPFAATPVVICQGGLEPKSVSREGIVFGGVASGAYRITGER
jgi:hypothetical protein